MEFDLDSTDTIVWEWNVEADQATFHPSETELEIVLRLCVLVDDQSVANVARSATVRSRLPQATEPLVEHFLDRMAYPATDSGPRGARDGRTGSDDSFHSRPPLRVMSL